MFKIVLNLKKKLRLRISLRSPSSQDFLRVKCQSRSQSRSHSQWLGRKHTAAVTLIWIWDGWVHPHCAIPAKRLWFREENCFPCPREHWTIAMMSKRIPQNVVPVGKEKIKGHPQKRMLEFIRCFKEKLNLLENEPKAECRLNGEIINKCLFV